MTKEQIIEIVNACVQYNANQGTWSIDNRFADELLALIEQEWSEGMKVAKITADRMQEFALKEQAREIFEKLYPCISRGAITYTIWVKDMEDLAKEYGVEL